MPNAPAARLQRIDPCVIVDNFHCHITVSDGEPPTTGRRAPGTGEGAIEGLLGGAFLPVPPVDLARHQQRPGQLERLADVAVVPERGLERGGRGG